MSRQELAQGVAVGLTIIGAVVVLLCVATLVAASVILLSR